MVSAVSGPEVVWKKLEVCERLYEQHACCLGYNKDRWVEAGLQRNWSMGSNPQWIFFFTI
jgi:hypothetical protein